MAVAHAKVVDDQERDRGQIGEIDLAGPVERGVGDLLGRVWASR